MKLWLDDIRPMPDFFDTWARTAEGAILLLRASGGLHRVTHISLDHDLGPHGSGYDVACEIEQQAAAKTLAPINVAIHSQNIVGRQRMLATLLAAIRRGAPISLADRF